MKRSILALLALSLLQSCGSEKKETPNYTIISGELLNLENPTFTLSGVAFEKEITVNADGTFVDTLFLDYDGTYWLGRQALYLHKGKNLSLKADVKNLKDLTFSGDLVAENTYFTEKAKLNEEILGMNRRELLSAEEDDFVKKLDDLKSKQLELLGKMASFNVDEFKEKELKNIDYGRALLLSDYEKYHPRFTKKDEFKVSEKYPKINITDYENGDDYSFSGSYRSLVLDKFSSTTEEEYKKSFGEEYKPEEYYKILIKNFKEIKNPVVKNGVAASELAYAISPSNSMSGVIYDEIIANTTSKSFKEEITQTYEKIKAIEKGRPSPKFDFENHKGGKTSLDDLKGKFVYVDVWATWCGPCVAEIPHLKEVEKKYHGKNIEFVSISIDDKKDYDKWKQFVTEKELVGVQLFAENAWKSEFVKDYVITGIPRFILIDTEGNIVSADAPRPSNPELIKTFDELGI